MQGRCVTEQPPIEPVETNPAYRLWKQHMHDQQAAKQDRLAILRTLVNSFDSRRFATETYCFAVPDDAVLELIGAHSPLVELGAGTGYWAALLQSRGADVIAYDNGYRIDGESAKPGGYWKAGPYTDVVQGDASALAAHADRTLLMVWPERNTMASDALETYSGDRVIYIGEGRGGATANDAFFDMIASDWIETQTLEVPQWDGVNDKLHVYSRRNPGSTMGGTE